jgi:hypothetical protein
MVAAELERKTAAGEQKMLGVARAKVNARKISAAIMAADE